MRGRSRFVGHEIVPEGNLHVLLAQFAGQRFLFGFWQTLRFILNDFRPDSGFEDGLQNFPVHAFDVNKHDIGLLVARDRHQLGDAYHLHGNFLNVLSYAPGEFFLDRESGQGIPVHVKRRDSRDPRGKIVRCNFVRMDRMQFHLSRMRFPRLPG